MPKIIDHDEYRKELVLKSAELFTRVGYAGLGMREIAKSLGISKSALYHYFPSKEALFQAVAEAAVQTDLAAFQPYMNIESNLAERLAAFSAYCADQEDWLIAQYLILMDYLRDKSLKEVRNDNVLQAATDDYIAFTAQFLELGDPGAGAGVMAFFTGLMMMRLFDGKKTDFNQTAAWFTNLIIQEMENRGSQNDT